MSSAIHRTALAALPLFAASLASLAGPALAQQEKPNILVLWGDDIGWYNVSAFCARTRSSARTRKRSATRPGGSSACTSWCRRRPSSPTGSRGLREFPPRQRPATFSLDQVMQKIQEGATRFS